jgi:glycosyltransferase involved in cell wall biosynthesis
MSVKQRPTRLLFIHQNFPGQFKRIALHLAQDPGYEVLSIGKQDCPSLPGVKTIKYELHRTPVSNTHHYVKPFEAGVLHGQAVLRVLLELRAKGFIPDVVVAHPGWGETLFLKVAFPNARVIHFCEFYYHAEGADVGFDPEFPVSLDDCARIRAKNALQLLNLESCESAISPTQWQKSLHPAAYQDKIRVIHEGIDTERLRPNPEARFTLPDGTVLAPGDQVVTYVSRNLEPYRGFHTFMRVLPRILAQNPGCRVVFAGGDDVSYGKRPKDFTNWREKMLAEVGDLGERVHFLGKIPYAQYVALLQVSAVHVYLTYPFVLSWSMLEAMSCGCVVVGSRTTPVLEVITDGENGLLVDFFDLDGIAAKVHAVLTDNAAYAQIRLKAASSVAAKYSHAAGLLAYKEIIEARD